jgi:azurin
MVTRKWLSVLAVTGALGLFSSMASAKTCSVEIEGNDQMQFNKQTIEIAADCTEVELTLKHVGKLPASAMGHNWVLTATPDLKDVATAGAKAGAGNNYVPKDERVIASTKLIGGGETATVKFSTSKLKKGGDYTYFCSFPGHWGLMKGKLIFG